MRKSERIRLLEMQVVRLEMLVELNEISEGFGNERWGAPRIDIVFMLMLGDIVEPPHKRITQ